MPPANDLKTVRKLAANENDCVLARPVAESLRGYGLASDDLLAILETELGDVNWFKSEATLKIHVPSVSDYYSIWVEECGCRMFLKLLVWTGDEASCLVITSFKKDNRYE